MQTKCAANNTANSVAILILQFGKNKSQFVRKETVHYSNQEARILGTLLSKFVKSILSLRIIIVTIMFLPQFVCIYLEL
jgi:hypothetical protein